MKEQVAEFIGVIGRRQEDAVALLLEVSPDRGDSTTGDSPGPVRRRCLLAVRCDPGVTPKCSETTRGRKRIEILRKNGAGDPD